jgi:hypothetical protein
VPHIVLTDEQLRILRESHGPVEVRDAQGQPVATGLTPLTPEDLKAIEHYKRTRGEKRQSIPMARVKAFLRKLHEIEASEGIDQEKVQELLSRLKAGEEL